MLTWRWCRLRLWCRCRCRLWLRLRLRLRRWRWRLWRSGQRVTAHLELLAAPCLEAELALLVARRAAGRATRAGQAAPALAALCAQLLRALIVTGHSGRAVATPAQRVTGAVGLAAALAGGVAVGAGLEVCAAV